MCPGDELILTCKTIGTGILRWTDPTDSEAIPVTFLSTTNINSFANYPPKFQSFILTFVSSNQTTVCSQATLNSSVTPLDNGKKISCSDKVNQPAVVTVTVRGKQITSL